jgi:sigma-B regulation protein RsbU (phosphoserine phosphatase)
MARAGRTPELARLLTEVDAALARLADGSYGSCETCREPIEADRVLADPLVRFCLDHLSASERRAFEHDLELTARIQRGLLPPAHTRASGWEVAYHYEPARVVSGDYCDYTITDSGDFYFMVGDVSGKGVAASMLMAHLHASLRTLVAMRLPLATMMERASHLFCESALPAQYATLVCGRATARGDLEICNAGHPPPLVIRHARVDRVDATGFPVGMFRDERFEVSRMTLGPHETLLLYTDGVVEAQDASGAEYGTDRLSVTANASRSAAVQSLVTACVQDLGAFRSHASPSDDLTVMALRRVGVEA